MKINSIYSKIEIENFGLKPGEGIKTKNIIYKMQNKVYFFEEMKNDELRLYSIINEKSFYL